MFEPFYRLFADNTNPYSRSAVLRKKRFALFLEILQVNRENSILDVGGSEATWNGTGFEDNVTLLNLKFVIKSPQFQYIECDACDMKAIGPKTFDIVYSNSVIEHIGGEERQREFAEGIRRVGKKYWVQTPNKHFPIEPHFLFPFFQYLPATAQEFVGTRWKYSHLIRHKENILDELSRLRLLNRKEMHTLFPDASFIVERYIGFIKSLIAYRGIES